MTVTEIAYMARRKAGITKSDAPNSVIISVLNALLSRFAAHFPDTYLTVATDTLTLADVSLALPATFQRFDEFRIGDYVYFLIDEHDLKYRASTEKFCYIRGANLYFNPAAETGDVYTLRYIAAPTVLTAMANTPSIPAEYHRDLAILVAFDITANPSPTLAEDYRNSMDRFKRIPRKAYPIREVKTVYQDERTQYISS